MATQIAVSFICAVVVHSRPSQFYQPISVFRPCAKADNGSWIAYEAVVHIRSWKRKAKVVVIHDLDDKGQVKSYRILVSTDLELDGGELIHMYQCRFQQEFLFRDAKQEAGLEHCQAYSWERIYFYVNVALSAVSLAKAAHHLDRPIEQRGAFSIADIKTRNSNEYQFRFVESTHKKQKLNPCGRRSVT